MTARLVACTLAALAIGWAPARDAGPLPVPHPSPWVRSLSRPVLPSQFTIPSALLGAFADDYGSEHAIAPDRWLQHKRIRYRIVAWHVKDQYLIAQNDSTNPSDAGLWTRIDWLLLPGMAPYEWGFCLSAYKAPSAAAAESTSGANRAAPRTGCNGFPFTRMKRAQTP